jgi:nucleoside-diphosphate-sugar epimerase
MVRDTLIQYLRGNLPLTQRKTAHCWAHVDDTATGHVLAMEKGRTGESYIIAGPAHTLTDALEIAATITGIKAPRIHAGPGAMRLMVACMGLIEKILPCPSPTPPKACAGVTYLGTSAKAERELGFKARTLEEGLRETLPQEMHLLDKAP